MGLSNALRMSRFSCRSSWRRSRLTPPATAVNLRSSNGGRNAEARSPVPFGSGRAQGRRGIEGTGVKLHLLDLGGDIAGNGLSKLFLTIAAAFAEAERDLAAEIPAAGLPTSWMLAGVGDDFTRRMFGAPRSGGSALAA
jgi:hypothetical protein